MAGVAPSTENRARNQIGTNYLRILFVGYQDTTLTSQNITHDTIEEMNIDDKNEKTCPVCQKHDEVIPIIYGEPRKRLFKDSLKGKVRLGGCVISDCDPNWFCKRDEKEF